MKQWFMKNQFRLLALASGSSMVLPSAIMAQTSVRTPGNVPQIFGDFESAFSSIFDIVIVVAGVIFVILVLVGGIQYLASAGNEDNTKKARQLILDGVIGLVIVVLAWAIGTYVLRLLGLSNRGEVPTGV